MFSKDDRGYNTTRKLCYELFDVSIYNDNELVEIEIAILIKYFPELYMERSNAKILIL